MANIEVGRSFKVDQKSGYAKEKHPNKHLKAAIAFRDIDVEKRGCPRVLGEERS